MSQLIKPMNRHSTKKRSKCTHIPDGTFDAVTSSLMMHHLPEHVEVKGLAEIKRVLKPGGRLLIADMMRPSTSFPKRFFTSLALHHGVHVQFGVEDLPKLLQEAGFAEIKQSIR